MNRFTRLKDELVRKMEKNARAEARLKITGYPRLIGTVIGVILMIVYAVWLFHH